MDFTEAESINKGILWWTSARCARRTLRVEKESGRGRGGAAAKSPGLHARLRGWLPDAYLQQNASHTNPGKANEWQTLLCHVRNRWILRG